jgi:hypothetical protein
MKGFLRMSETDVELLLERSIEERQKLKLLSVKELHSLYVHTLSSVPEGLRLQVKEDIFSILQDWKVSHGVYPPMPSNLILAAYKLTNTPLKHTSMKFADYALTVSKEEAESIKPWQCYKGINSLIALYLKLVDEAYEPIASYVERSALSSSQIISVLMSIGAESSNDAFDACLVQAAQKLVIALHNESMPFVQKENNRKLAQFSSYIDKSEKQMIELSAVIKRLEISSNGRRVSNKAIAREMNVSQPTVARLLKKLRLRGGA